MAARTVCAVDPCARWEMRVRFCSSLFAFLVHVFGGKAAWRGVASVCVCGWVVDGLRMDGGLSSSLLCFLFTFVQMLSILQPTHNPDTGSDF